MAWRRPGAKPLSEPMMVYFIDAYMCHSVSMSYVVNIFQERQIGPAPSISSIEAGSHGHSNNA